MSHDATMHAIMQDEFGGPEVLRWAKTRRPVPLPTEVLVRVHAAGINPIDLKTRAGGGMAPYLGDLPLTVGWDVSGVVEEIGYGVSTLAPGDEVFGMPWFPRGAGGYAEYVTAPSRQFARKPARLMHEQAAAVPLTALTAWQILHDTAQLRAGQRVLVHGAGGGVGRFAVQFAKVLGAHVTATGTARQYNWLRWLGADELIDYTTTRFEDVAHDIDVVVDVVGDGHDTTSTRSLGVMRPGGVIVVVPSAAPDIAQEARVRGLRAARFQVEPDGRALSRIAALIDSGKVQVGDVDVLPLAEAAQAHEIVENRRTHNKVVLRAAG
ncbi:NADP-dependent oxidoreductase [Streptomyces sp. NPDC001262]|uniref:NADP-dependent oxidoreductase n=1 Tax=Streptomyces sp. NPDC001262 TaxID=3364552 RepID=UPI0036C440EF